MADRIDQPQDQPTLTPQPSRILAQPATVAACTADYDAAKPVRIVMDNQATKKRS